MSDTKLIFKKIADVMVDIEAIAKERNNSQQGYKFRGIDDVYNMIHPLLSKHRIFTVPRIVKAERSERKSNSGGVLLYSIIEMEYTFYAEDGSSVVSQVIGEGMDSGDKASNKAMAVAHKYCLTQTFAVPTEDDKDPENDSPKIAPKQAPAPNVQPKGDPKKAVTPNQLKRLYAIQGQSEWSEADVKAYMHSRFGIDSSKDLKMGDYDILCNAIQAGGPPDNLEPAHVG